MRACYIIKIHTPDIIFKNKEGKTMLKNTAFTLSVLAIVALALIFPDIFRQIGDYKLTGLIVPLLMIIMFGMGTSVGVADFVRVAKMPKHIAVGLICQFTIMPFIGMSLALMSGLPPKLRLALYWLVVHLAD